MSSRDRQVGGDHYSRHKIQPFDIIDEYGLDFYEGNALKYLLRHKTSRVEDLEKAVHYLEKCIERAKAAAEPRYQCFSGCNNPEPAPHICRAEERNPFLSIPNNC